jgi:hypothetical protein
MGHPGSVSRLLSAGRADEYLTMNRRELVEILFTEKKAPNELQPCESARTGTIDKILFYQSSDH